MSLPLSKTQRETLERLLSGSRAWEASDVSNLLLERLGYMQRVGAPRPHRLASHTVIEWAITDAGRAVLDGGGRHKEGSR